MKKTDRNWNFMRGSCNERNYNNVRIATEGTGILEKCVKMAGTGIL